MARTREFFEHLYKNVQKPITFKAIEEPKPADRQPKVMLIGHGDYAESLDSLISFNRKWGIFYVSGDTEGEGEKDKDVKRQYAFFIDIDDAPLPESFPIEPSCICTRSELKHHVYWFVGDPITDMEEWRALQKILIKFYGSDETIHNPSQLMRVPDSFNFKDSAPMRHNIVKLDPIYYTPTQLLSAHTSHENKLKWANERIKRMAPKEPLQDGDGRYKFMRACTLIYHDYDLPDSTVKSELRKISTKHLAAEYTEAQLDHVMTVKKSAKNEEGVSAKEKQLREQIKKDNFQKEVKDWYFVAQVDAMVNKKCPNETMLTRSAFNVKFAHITEHQNSIGWAAANDILNKVDGLVYEPGQGKEIQGDYATYINLWEPSPLQPVAQEPTWFIDHITWLLNNNENDANHFFDYLACMVQKPRVRINHSIVIIGQNKGTGKSTIYKVLQQVFGKTNCSAPENEHLEDKYTPWAKSSKLCFIHELAQSDKMKFTKKIKSMITEDEIYIREMYHQPYRINNYMQIIATSNYLKPLKLEKDDRRFWVVESRVRRRSKEYYDELYKNVEERSGEVLHWLQQRDISQFHPKAEPPVTRTKTELLEESISELERSIKEIYENQIAPLDGQFFSISDYTKLPLPLSLQNDKSVTAFRVSTILRELGAERIDRSIKVDGKVNKYLVIRNQEQLLEMEERGEDKEVNKLIREEYKRKETQGVF